MSWLYSSIFGATKTEEETPVPATEITDTTIAVEATTTTPDEIPTPGVDVPTIVWELDNCTDDDVKRLQLLKDLKHLTTISDQDQCALVGREIVASGIIPKLVQWLGDMNQDIVFECIWLIVNISFVEDNVLNAAIPELIRVINPLNTKFSVAAIHGIGNIVSSNNTLRLEVLKTDVLERIHEILTECTLKPSELEDVLFSVNNLSRSMYPKNQTKSKILKGLSTRFIGIASILVKYVTENHLNAENALAVNLAIRTLSDIVEVNSECITRVLDLNIPIHYCQQDIDADVRLSSLLLLTGIVSQSDEETTMALDAGYLGTLQTLANHADDNIRLNVYFSIGNILAGNSAQVHALIAQKFVKNLVATIPNEKNSKILIEQLWGIAHMARTDKIQHINYVLHLNILSVLIELFDRRVEEVSIVVTDILNSFILRNESIAYTYQTMDVESKLREVVSENTKFIQKRNELIKRINKI